MQNLYNIVYERWNNGEKIIGVYPVNSKNKAIAINRFYDTVAYKKNSQNEDVFIIVSINGEPFDENMFNDYEH